MNHAMTYCFVSILTVAMLAATGCESVNQMLGDMSKPSARITGTSISDLTAENMGLTFDVDVSNPYPVPLPLASLDYKLTSDGKPIADGKQQLDGTIPASGSRTIQLPVNLAFKQIANAISGFRPGSVIPYEAAVNLSANAPGVGDVSLPVERKGELPVPTVPDIKLTNMNIENLSLTNVKAKVDMAMTNTNQFNLGVEDIHYNLKLGGNEVASSKIDKGFNLKPGETTNMSFPLEFSPLSFGRSIYNMLTGSQAGYALTGNITGNTPLGPINLPYDKTGTMPLSR